MNPESELLSSPFTEKKTTHQNDFDKNDFVNMSLWLQSPPSVL